MALRSNAAFEGIDTIEMLPLMMSSATAAKEAQQAITESQDAIIVTCRNFVRCTAREERDLTSCVRRANGTPGPIIQTLFQLGCRS